MVKERSRSIVDGHVQASRGSVGRVESADKAGVRLGAHCHGCKYSILENDGSRVSISKTDIRAQYRDLITVGLVIDE